MADQHVPIYFLLPLLAKGSGSMPKCEIIQLQKKANLSKNMCCLNISNNLIDTDNPLTENLFLLKNTINPPEQWLSLWNNKNTCSQLNITVADSEEDENMKKAITYYFLIHTLKTIIDPIEDAKAEAKVKAQANIQTQIDDDRAIAEQLQKQLNEAILRSIFEPSDAAAGTADTAEAEGRPPAAGTSARNAFAKSVEDAQQKSQEVNNLLAEQDRLRAEYLKKKEIYDKLTEEDEAKNERNEAKIGRIQEAEREMIEISQQLSAISTKIHNMLTVVEGEEKAEDRGQEDTEDRGQKDINAAKAKSLFTFIKEKGKRKKDEKTAIGVVEKQAEVDRLLKIIRNNPASDETNEAENKIKKIVQGLTPEEQELIKATELYNRQLEDQAHERRVAEAKKEERRVMRRVMRVRGPMSQNRIHRGDLLKGSRGSPAPPLLAAPHVRPKAKALSMAVRQTLML